MSVLNVHELGDPAGPPLLAIHGVRAHGRRFRRLAEEAWPERRTIAVDLRGHGRSTYDAPWSIEQHVADLIETLSDLEAVDVVGHSYGGEIALHLLATHPERVRRLVMLDPAIALDGDRGSREALAAIADPGWGSVEDATEARAAGLFPGTEAAVAEDIAEHLVQGEDGRFRLRFHKPAVVTGWGELCRPIPQITTRRPALLVVAEQADFVSDAVLAGLHEQLDPDLTVVTLDCGHMVYWDRFEETAAAVAGFLRAE
ncbi:MAG TPA: alpha/beta hydrolase [Ilumatobacteraceae bacterium]